MTNSTSNKIDSLTSIPGVQVPSDKVTEVEQPLKVKRKTSEGDEQTSMLPTTSLGKRGVAKANNIIKIKDIANVEDFRNFLKQKDKSFLTEQKNKLTDKRKNNKLFTDFASLLATPFIQMLNTGMIGIQDVLSISKELSVKNTLRILSVIFIPVFFAFALIGFLSASPIVGIGKLTDKLHALIQNKRHKTLLTKNLTATIFFALLTKENTADLDKKTLQSLAKSIEKEINNANTKDIQNIDFIIQEHKKNFDFSLDQYNIKEQKLQLILETTANKALENIIKKFGKNKQDHIDILKTLFGEMVGTKKQEDGSEFTVVIKESLNSAIKESLKLFINNNTDNQSSTVTEA